MAKNKKSDVAAKAAFIKVLESKGYRAEVKSAPADIVATRDGETWYYEIKKTSHHYKYFGTATLTEWKQALKTPDRFRFVVAIANSDDTEFEFVEYTPQQFLEFSTIPPFKIFFNIDFSNKNCQRKSGSRAIRLIPEALQMLDKCFEELKGTYLQTDDLM